MRRLKIYRPSLRCSYREHCYLASELKCYGYMTDCALYRKTNGEQLAPSRFDHAVNKLINRTREKHLTKVEG